VKAAATVALVALALPGCGDSGHDLPVPNPTVRKVARRLPSIRGLHFKRVPEVRVVSTSEFQSIETRLAAAAVRRLSPRDRARAARLRAEARIAEQLPVLLGLLERLPRQKAVNRAAHVVAVYVGVEDRVYLIAGHTRGRRAESVVSHELTHALEQQNLGTEKPQLSSPFSDAADARFAVKEGSATLTQFRYARRYLHERESIADRLREPPPDLAGSRLDRYLQDGADFSYRRGARFVDALYRRGGVALVNRAVRHPPVTTASILDPSRWPADDRPLPPPGHVTPGRGWARSYSGTFGAASTRQLFLADPGPAAARLVGDWRGGTIELWQRPPALAHRAKPTRSTCVTVVRWRWRGPSDVAMALDSIDPYLREDFRARPLGNAVWSWRGGGAALSSTGSTTTLAIAPSAVIAAATVGGP
jgi:hypothetical protein